MVTSTWSCFAAEERSPTTTRQEADWAPELQWILYTGGGIPLKGTEANAAVIQSIAWALYLLYT